LKEGIRGVNNTQGYKELRKRNYQLLELTSSMGGVFWGGGRAGEKRRGVDGWNKALKTIGTRKSQSH